MDRQYDLSQVTPSNLTAPLWWEEITTRGLRHITNFGWQTEHRPDPAVDFPGITVLASYITEHTTDHLLWIDDTLVAMFWGRGELNVMVAGKVADFKELEAKLHVIFPEQVEEDETRVALKFWFNAPNGMGAAYSRLLSVPEWSEIEANYGGVIRDEMKRLCAPEFRPSHGGQLMLWQGPPGTGKTFAIRALVREWVKWCDGAYIVDPDSFFHNANYMMQVMLDEGSNRHIMYDPEADGDEELVRWKLIILEDSGELLSADAKQRTGQALSRLLNIADGLIGQGLRVLILITTNEEMDSLHEAVSRPGRCASKIVFPRLNKDEAAAWLEAHSLPPDGKDHSLAELYGEVEGFTKKAEKSPAYKTELGFAKKTPERRAIGFNVSQPSPAKEIGPLVPDEQEVLDNA